MTMIDQQRRLTALGLYDGRADGIWGPDTEAAVSAVIDMAEKARGIVPAKPVEVVSKVSGDFPLPVAVPGPYRWSGTIGTLPRLLQEGLALYGLKEGLGSIDNPAIMEMAKEVGQEKVYVHDSIAWCGLYMAACVKRAGYDVVAGPLWALNWLNFGVKAETPSLGDIMCFVRDGGGHVGFYIAEDRDYYHVLGGNTGDAVKIARLAKSRFKGARRPAYRNPLPAWKPYKVAATGAISTNEA